MSRRHRAEKREVLPDPKFGDIVLSRFMNVLMYDGKKSVARSIVYNAIELFGKKVNSENFIEVFSSIISLRYSVKNGSEHKAMDQNGVLTFSCAERDVCPYFQV